MSHLLLKSGLAALASLGLVGTAHHLMSEKRVAVSAADAAPARPGPVPPTSVGINLGGGDYWISEWRLNDLVQNAASLARPDEQGHWGPLEGHVRTDVHGYPVDVGKGQQIIVILSQGASRLRAGAYRCRISPGWEVRPFGNAQIGGSGPQFRMTITSAEAPASVSLILTARADRSNLSQLSCLPDGDDGRVAQAFLSDVKPFAVLRFLDLMRANDAPPREWARRATPASLTQGGAQGISVEDMVEIANTAGADPWFNLPLDADPDYYRQFATYVRDHLGAGRRAYVELSNEVWNTGFEQGRQAVLRGKQTYPGVDDVTASDFYYADRVRALMAIWSEVFRGQEKRIVRVLASQAVWTKRPEQTLAHKDTWRSVDALATAPYFGSDDTQVTGAGKDRVDALFRKGPAAVEEAIGHAKAAKRIAQRYGLRYVSYEGGSGYGGFRPETQADLVAVNRDPRIRDLYLLYLNRWRAEVGDLLMIYQSVSTPGPGGFWGHKDYTGQPVSEAPKMAALYEFLGYRQPIPAKR